MRMRNSRRWTVGLVAVVAAAGLVACGSDDDCKTVAAGNAAAALIAAPTPPPVKPPVKPPVVVNPPKVNTPPPTRATTTRATTTTRTATRATTAPTATSKATTPTAIVPTNPVALTAGKKLRQLSGEKAYYPTPLVKQAPANVLIAQESVRKLIAEQGRFTKSTRYYSPVTKRWYVYHDDDTYTSKKKVVPQDPYDPFDIRNWTHPLSPFNLTLFIINGQPISNGPNVLNGDYEDDEAPADTELGTGPSADPSPSDAGNRC